jgi:hypothetical protein
MRESNLTEELKPNGKKRVHPAAIAGPAVAIGASLLAVFISTSGNKDETPDPASAVEAPAAEGSDPLVTAQSAPQTPQPPTPGVAGAESANAIAFADPQLEFSAALPPQDQNGPIIAKLRKEAEDLLAKTKKEATEGHAEARANGQTPMTWDYQINWTVLARSGDVVSLMGTLYQFSGGAHGMTSTDTRLASIKTGEEIDFSGMMRFGKVPSPALVIAACEAVKKVKTARIDSATVFDDPIVCAGPSANVRLEDASIALAPSNIADKFGGIYVYFDPYAIGAYAEGSYEVVVQQDVFAEDLKPEFKALFAGTAPPPSQDN